MAVMRALTVKEYHTLLLAVESLEGRVIVWGSQRTAARLIRDGFVIEHGKLFITAKGRRAVRLQGMSGGRA
jgi:hypothetical protein